MFPVKKTLIILSLIIGILFFPPASWASVTFDLIAPSGQLVRGQEVPFTITINTGGANIKSTQVGLAYQTQYLQYLSITPGDAMTEITTTDLGGGKILISGSNPSGFSGNGNFAYVSFKIIAEAPGSTELCSLFAPATTPTSTPAPTGIIAPIIAPTQLPKSGDVGLASAGTIIGILTVGFASYLLFTLRKNYPQPQEKHKPYHKDKLKQK